jgi:hypothetical protein
MTTMSSRRAALALLLSVALGTTAVACSSGKKKVSLNSSGSTTTVAGDTSTTAGGDAAGSGSTVPGGGAATPTTVKAGGATTTAKPGGTSTGPGTSSTAGAKPGQYKYALSGTGAFGPVSGDEVDTIDPANGADQHSSSKDPSGNATSETVLHFQSDGVYLKDLKLIAGVTKEFVFDPIGLAVPLPATVGRTWQWGPYTSTDGKTKISATGKILRTEAVPAGSESVDCVVVELTVTTHGDIETTSTQDLWASQKYNLTIQEHDVVNGSATFGNPPTTYPVHSDTWRKLHSTQPS